MLLTLITWIYIFFITFNLGYLFFMLTGRVRRSYSIEIYSLAGIPVLAVLLSIFSLFINIGLTANLLIVTPLLVFFIWQFREIKQNIIVPDRSVLYLLSAALFFALVLVKAVKTPFVSDTGFYHAQTIKWFESFEVVKGLANLHGRFGFNSHYHLICALFRFSEVIGSTLGNAFPSYLFLLFSFYCIGRVFRRERSAFDLFFYSGVLLLILINYRPWISSPSPDFPATVFSILVLSLLIDYFKHKSEHLPYLIVVFTLFLLTVKISAIPVVLAPVSLLFFLENKDFRKKYIAFSIITGFIVVSPWLVRNVIMTGYLVYPFPYLDLFSFKWKVPDYMIFREKEWVKSFARMYSYDWKYVSQLKLSEWFPLWWNMKTFVEKLIFVTITASPFIIMADFVIQYKRNKRPLFIYLVWLLTFAGVCFWFIMAPYFRFAHGVIFVCFLLTVYLAFSRVRSLIGYGTLIVLFGFSAYSLVRKGGEVDYSENLIEPEGFYPVENIKKVSIDDGVKVYIPDDGHCWNFVLPCSPYVEEGLKLLGDDIGDGFYIDQE